MATRKTDGVRQVGSVAHDAGRRRSVGAEDCRLSRKALRRLTASLAFIDRWLLRLWWVPTIMLSSTLGVLVYWAAERTPPIELVHMPSVAGKRGDVIRFMPIVERDVGRDCDVVAQHTLIDGSGFAIALPPIQLDSWMVRQREHHLPGVVPIEIPVPTRASPGLGSYEAVITYTCNPVHKVWPIKVYWSAQVRILP